MESDRRPDRHQGGRVRRTLPPRRPQSAPHADPVPRRRFRGGVGSSLAAITGVAGAPRAANCLLHAKSDDELSSRRCQLNDLLTRQELAAAEEIRQAVLAIDIRLQQVVAENSADDHFRDLLQTQRLLRERPGSTVTVLDIAATDLKLLDAQRELVHQVMALRIAQVKLKEAQGLLVFECCPCGEATAKE